MANNLAATVVFPDGQPLTFNIADGVDMGVYVPPSGTFRQRCIRVRNPALPHFFVDFRLDEGTSRFEVVFWNGEVFGSVPSGYTRDLPAYNCTITNDGATVKTQRLPFHYWGTRWRHQSSRRPVIRTVDQIFSEKWLPPMSREAARLTYPGVICPPPIPPLENNPFTGNPPWTPFDPPNGTPYKNLTLAADVKEGDKSITVAGGTVDRNDRVVVKLDNGHWQTFFVVGTADGATTFAVDKEFSFSASAGAPAKTVTYDLNLLMNNDGGGGGQGRPEIGIITDSQAEYLLTTGERQQNALDTMMAQAEMCASQWNSMFLPDSETGAPVNYKQDAKRYASYTRNSIGTGPYDPKFFRIQGGAINTIYNNNGSEHMGNHFYIPYALMEDPYLAEAMQYALQWDKGYDIYNKETWLGKLAEDPTGNSCIIGARGLWSYQSEPRNIGWGVRNTAVAWKSAPGMPPSWMLGKDYFAAIGQDEATLIDMTLTKSTDTLQTVFRNPCQNDLIQVFETSYFVGSVGLAHTIGHPHGTAPSWFLPLDYFFGQIDALTNGTSGWNRQCPQITNEDPQWGVRKFSSQRPPPGVVPYKNWAEVWAARGKDYQSGPYKGSPEPRCQQFTSSLPNISAMVAAAGIAKSCGVPAAASAFAWLNALIDDSYPAPLINIQFEMKWGFSGAPLTDVPAPAPEQMPIPQPTEEPPVSNTDDQKLDDALNAAKANDARGDTLLQRFVALLTKWTMNQPDPAKITIDRAKFDELVQHVQGGTTDLDGFDAKLTEAESA